MSIADIAEGFANAAGNPTAVAQFEKRKDDRAATEKEQLQAQSHAIFDEVRKLQDQKLKLNPKTDQESIANIDKRLTDLQGQFTKLYHPSQNPGALAHLPSFIQEHLGKRPAPSSAEMGGTNPKLDVPKTPGQAKAQFSWAGSPAGVGGQQNPILLKRQQMQEAGFTPDQIAKVEQIDAGLEPKATNQKEPVSKEPVPIYESGTLVGIKDPQGNKTYTDPKDPNIPPEYKKMWADIEGRLNASASKKEESTEAKENRQLAREEKLAQIHADIQERARELTESRKIPTLVATRVSQAEIIKEQIADLRTKLEDPELQKYIGPVVGRAGGVTRLYSKKVQDFYAAQESLDALLPLLHAYRGGAQVHQLFHDSMGSLTITPGAYKGTLDALDKLSDNVIGEVKDEYPNAPMFKNKETVTSPAQAKQLMKGTAPKGQGQNDPLGIR